MKLFCDIWTGQLRKSLDGGPLGSLTFYARDILDLELVFTDGNAPVTSTVLADSALLKVGLKAQPGSSTILALASSYTLAEEVASMVFSLNTSAMTSFFSSNVPSSAFQVPLFLEIEVSSADESRRRTYHQSPCVVRREVNMTSDTNPPTVDTALYVLKAALFDANGRWVSPFGVGFRGEIAARTGGASNALDAIATTALTAPFCVIIRIAGAGEIWALVAGTDTEDGSFIVRPDDYNALTNAKVWTRLL